MIICERCGYGFHESCLKKLKQTTTYEIGKEAWYCQECLEYNEKQPIKDITMDFECIDYLKEKLNL